MLVGEVDEARALRGGHEEADGGGLEDEVVGAMGPDELGVIEGLDHGDDVGLREPPVDGGDEEVVVEAVLADGGAVGHAAGDGEGDELGVGVDVELVDLVADLLALVGRAAVARELGAARDEGHVDAGLGHLSFEDRRRKASPGGSLGDFLRRREAADEFREGTRALRREHLVAVDVAPVAHRGEEVVGDARQQEAVVVHAHDPLVAQGLQRRPDGDGVEANHLSIAQAPDHLRQLLDVDEVRHAPARRVRQQAEPHVRAAFQRVGVLPREVALVPHDDVRLVHLPVVQQRVHRRVQSIRVRRVVRRMLLLPEVDDHVLRPTPTRAIDVQTLLLRRRRERTTLALALLGTTVFVTHHQALLHLSRP
mmetsp:Transcript_13771/g.44908  ORF Transcript_13771/g.44908 Transcript_13771/m.44908 type:complete len:366 (-) Transcript_13771:173-1270(-)